MERNEKNREGQKMEQKNTNDNANSNTATDTDTDIAITYQNKDIVSKLFGDQMKGKSLSLFGLKTNLRVVDIRPTNIPIVQARELRMDNLFELEDGSVAILDYESEYKEANFTKYGRYLMDVIDRYLKEGKQPDIHMMVLYTADIEKTKTVFSRTACQIQVEASYMTGLPSDAWLKEVQKGIADHAVTDEILMHLVLLPLTYKGEEKKQEAIRACVDLAKQLPNKEQETFALAGILTFTDKIINDETKRYIKEVLGMTQVGKMLMDEGRQEGRQEGLQEGLQKGLQKGQQKAAKKTAKNMLKRGDSIEDIAEVLELPIETIKAWEKEFFAVV